MSEVSFPPLEGREWYGLDSSPFPSYRHAGNGDETRLLPRRVCLTPPPPPDPRGVRNGKQWTPSNPATLGTSHSVPIRVMASFQCLKHNWSNLKREWLGFRVQIRGSVLTMYVESSPSWIGIEWSLSTATPTSWSGHARLDTTSQATIRAQSSILFFSISLSFP